MGDNLVTEKQHILDSWTNEFEGLYNTSEEVTQEFDSGHHFFDNIMRHMKVQLELEMTEADM